MKTHENPRAATATAGRLSPLKRILTAATVLVATLVTLTVAPQPAAAAGTDCNNGVDAGNDFTVAMVVTPPVACDGSTIGLDDTDFYQFYVTRGKTIDISTTSDTIAPVDACLYDPLGVQASCGDVTSVERTIAHMAPTTGWWRLRIYQGILGGTYSMSIGLTSDCNSGGDGGGSYAAATAIAVPAYCRGHLGSGTDTADWYRFSVTAGQTISVYLAADDVKADFDVCLFSPTNATVPVACSIAAAGAEDSLTVTATATGSWRAQVYDYAAIPGWYDLEVFV